MLSSMMCKYDDFTSDWYRNQEINLAVREIWPDHPTASCDFAHRKFWEWCAISQVLDERTKLRTGMRGLGFAVGTEPLPSHFAARGCQILATDLAPEMSQGNWIETGQHAASKAALLYSQLVNPGVFERRVSFQSVDMRTLDGLIGEFDFIWSSCALEHLGSLQAGSDFVVHSARFLAPGGVAVHTTEVNVLSNDVTLEEGWNVIYRQKDISALADNLLEHGYRLLAPTYSAGEHPYDLHFSQPPYVQPGLPHLKLDFGGHVCTSMLLIVEKLPEPEPKPARRWFMLGNH